jgi:hypothetical protein
MNKSHKVQDSKIKTWEPRNSIQTLNPLTMQNQFSIEMHRLVQETKIDSKIMSW